jgi:dihydrofolate reductase
MRKIVTTTMLSLDGVMQAPGGSKEDTAEGFQYGGWQGGYWNEEGDEIMDTKIQAGPFDLLLGRRTYDIFTGYWPAHKDEPHWGKPFDRAIKYVVSHKPIKLTWDKSELITGDLPDRQAGVVAAIKKLKQLDGPDLLIYGSSNLIQTLLKHNLIDRMHLWIFPVTIGTGKKLFAEGTRPERFKPVDAKITSTGILFATYEPATPLKKAQ